MQKTEVILSFNSTPRRSISRKEEYVDGICTECTTGEGPKVRAPWLQGVGFGSSTTRIRRRTLYTVHLPRPHISPSITDVLGGTSTLDERNGRFLMG